jgi:hypothetical protein
VKLHPLFLRARAELDRSVAAGLDAALQLFLRQWRDGVSEADLARLRWRYKAPRGREARRLHVRQIHVDQQHAALRVALTIVAEQRVIWLLHVYGKRNEDQEILRAVDRARQIREGGP